MAAEYTQSELLNEVSRIFRAQLDPGREGGTLNTRTEYQQLLEMASITFLLNNDAIFYLAFLTRNLLYSTLKTETALIEDMLVALEDLGQLGQPVRDTTTLSNANTALLSLDAASSVTNRPETQRFSDLMDKFARQYHPNVVSRSTRTLVRPREDARNILKTDLDRLKTTHDQLLVLIFALRDLMENFVSLDIPSKVAATTINSIRTTLEALSNTIETDDAAPNIARSRDNVLTALASKIAVNLLSQFTDPRALKIRTPINPIPSTIRHLGRVTGEGEPASIISSPGPWPLPISEPLVLLVNKTTSLSVGIDQILGATLNGRIAENFYPTSDQQELHVIVDPEVRVSALGGGTTTSEAVFSEFMPLGFKHLGTTVTFPRAAVSGTIEPFYRNLSPRVIQDHRILQTFTVAGYNPTTRMVVLQSAVAGDEPGTGLRDDHVGAYLHQNVSGTFRRWEILEVIPPPPLDPNWYAIVSVPDAYVPQASVSCSLRGQTTAAGGTKFTFAVPHAVSAPTGNAIIGPTVKTARFDTPGPKTVAQLIASVQANQGSYNTFYTGDVSQALNQHVLASEVAGSPGKLALTIRSKQNPYIKISDRFIKVSNTVPQPTPPAALETVQASAHSLLGFRIGESDTVDTLTPAELVNWINDIPNSGVLAEVVETELSTGTSLELQVTLDPAEVIDPSTNFDEFVQVGDQIEIFSSGITNGGIFQVTTVDGTRLVLDRGAFSGAEVASYRIFRQQVKVSTTKKSRGCSLEVTSGPAELGFQTGVQYGSIPFFEAVDKFGSNWVFSGISPGDRLRIVGSSETAEISEVQDTVLTLATGLPSNIENAGFEVQSTASQEYNQLQENLTTYTASPVLLKNHHYDENLNELDAVLTSAILPGQNFVANRNRAKQFLIDLLSILTTNLQRSSEYSITMPTVSLVLEDVITNFVVAPVEALDNMIETFTERKYDRAVGLLRSSQIVEFYDTDEETGSYSGAVISASRTVVRDLPKSPSAAYAVDNELNLASKFQAVPNAEDNFNDTEETGV